MSSWAYAIKTFGERILDSIFPRPPIETYTPERFVGETADSLSREVFSNDRLWAAFQYQHVLVRTAIWQLKYNGSRHVAELLAEAFVPHLIEHIADTFVLTENDTLYIVSVPADDRRERERDTDHMKLLCEALPHSVFAYIPLLGRTRSTEQQTKQKNKAARLTNVANSMRADSETIPKGAPIIVIDDVITTGATMQEAFRALSDAGYTNYIGVSIAH